MFPRLFSDSIQINSGCITCITDLVSKVPPEFQYLHTSQLRIFIFQHPFPEFLEYFDLFTCGAADKIRACIAIR